MGLTAGGHLLATAGYAGRGFGLTPGTLAHRTREYSGPVALVYGASQQGIPRGCGGWGAATYSLPLGGLLSKMIFRLWTLRSS